MFSKGILYVKQLTNENGHFHTLEELANLYGVNVNFLTYFSIIHAIPTVYKDKLKDDQPKAISVLDSVIKKEKMSKFIYNDLISKKSSFPTKARAYYASIFNIELQDDTFMICFEAMYCSTKNTKLLDFQFRILHNAIITNIQLKKWGIKNCDNCSFCGNTQETLIHLLLNCPHSSTIWSEMSNYIHHHAGVYMNMDDTEIILGVKEKPFANFYNTISTIIKQYIYSCRCLSVKPVFRVVLEKIKFEKYAEKSFAVKNNKIMDWSSKWELLKHLEFSVI